MKYLTFLVLVILLTVAASCGKKSSGLPNIILIVADDLGWKDVGFMGSFYYETPNLDRLAGEGMVFRQAYAGAANCAPSRASLMTGVYATAHGVYTVGSSERGDTRMRRLIPVTNTDTLHDRFFTLAEALKQSGYTTINIGKWHLGNDPCSQGMDYNVGGSRWGHPKSYFAPYINPDLDALQGEYLTDRLTEEAIGFMRQHNDHPFFLYLSYYAVHTPLQPKQSYEQKYIEKGAVGCQSNASYAGMVDNLDSCIGRLMEALDQLGLHENTLVIFTSDNGGIREISCQDPLRAGKGSYYEGGIRVPLVFRWPGKIEKGSVTEAPVINMDFYPTLMEITGKEPPENLDGLSLWPLLKGEGSLAERSLYFHFPIYLQAYRAGYDDGRDPLFRTRPCSVIREGEWKLHYYYEDGGTELYNLNRDPGERNNLANVNISKREELKGKLNVWLEQENAPVHFNSNPQFDALFEQKRAAAFY
ncbi:MAG: sulfatase [Bacteroidales bacterium]|nr:sulfatase [Bacteroidales bacterium]